MTIFDAHGSCTYAGRMWKTSRARVLVVEDVMIEAKLLMRALADAGYANLVHCPDFASAVAEIGRTAPKLVVTDLRLGDSTGIELTKHIRKVDKSYIYVVMLTSAGADTVLGDCFDAGVDDFIEKPFRPHEITARLRAGERVVELETQLRAKNHELETALRRIDVSAAVRALTRAAETAAAEVAPPTSSPPLDALARTQTWREAESLLIGTVNEFLQLPFRSARMRHEWNEAFVGEVLLSDPSTQLELMLSVVVEPGSMKRFAKHLLDDDDREGAEALILELSNILMGTFKTAFMPQGFSFTGGIPASATFSQTRAAFDKAPVRARVAVGAGDSDVEFWLRVSEKRNRAVLGRALREGLVVGEDVCDARGMLLVRAGSRLTDTGAKRIAKLLPDLEITVSDPNG